jgi:hypothetical protein
VHNSPHLTAAYELDTALLQYSENLKSYNLPTLINSESDLDAVIDGIKTHVLQELRLWEFYTIDVKKSIEELRKALQDDEGTEDDSLFKDFDIACLDLSHQVRLITEALEPKAFGPRQTRKIRKSAALAFAKKWRDTKVKAAILKAIATAKDEVEERLKVAVDARTAAEPTISSEKDKSETAKTEAVEVTSEEASAEIEDYVRAISYVEAKFKDLAKVLEVGIELDVM